MSCGALDLREFFLTWQSLVPQEPRGTCTPKFAIETVGGNVITLLTRFILSKITAHVGAIGTTEFSDRVTDNHSHQRLGHNDQGKGRTNTPVCTRFCSDIARESREVDELYNQWSVKRSVHTRRNGTIWRVTTTLVLQLTSQVWTKSFCIVSILNYTCLFILIVWPLIEDIIKGVHKRTPIILNPAHYLPFLLPSLTQRL